jgi:hypothetical protein
MSLDFTNFPFNFKLHLGPYINHVLKVGETNPELVSRELLSRIRLTIREHPELMEIIDDVRDVEPHQDFLKDLFSTLIPLRGASTSVQAITLPFTAMPYLVATEAYEN